MKRILIFVLLTAFVSCQKKDVGPELPTSDALYRTWRLTQFLYDGQPIPPEQYIDTVTFPKSGSFQGSASKNSFAWCCHPIAFEGNNDTIRFIWDTSNTTCALINCKLSPLSGEVNWQIITLNDTSLVLTGGNTVLVFEA